MKKELYTERKRLVDIAYQHKNLEALKFLAINYLNVAEEEGRKELIPNQQDSTVEI